MTNCQVSVAWIMNEKLSSDAMILITILKGLSVVSGDKSMTSGSLSFKTLESCHLKPMATHQAGISLRRCRHSW